MNRGEGCAVDENLLSLIIILITILVMVIVAVLGYGYNYFRIKFRNRKSRILREQLLEKADYYLEPYSNIWTYQKLVCSGMRAEIKVYVITIENDSEIFKIKGNNRAIQAVWNDVLKNFSNEIDYYDLVESIYDWHFDRKSINFSRKAKNPAKPKVTKTKVKDSLKEKTAEVKRSEICDERQVDL